MSDHLEMSELDILWERACCRRAPNAHMIRKRQRKITITPRSVCGVFVRARVGVAGRERAAEEAGTEVTVLRRGSLRVIRVIVVATVVDDKYECRQGDDDQDTR